MPDAPIHLRRIDPTRAMARFYALELAPTLFGPVALVRRWGRIGTAGRILVEFHDGEAAARAAAARWERAKRRRGYVDAG